MLLVVPDVPDLESRKPIITAIGVLVRGDTLSCEALIASQHVPEQTLTAHLHERGRKPRVMRVSWSPIEPGVAHKNAVIDIVKEP